MAEEHMEEDCGSEEEGPDWRMFSKYTKSLGARVTGECIEPFIPRRGEKDFEPIESLASEQTRALRESRNALFAALSAGVRGHSYRDHVRCVWTGVRPSHQLDINSRAPSPPPPYVDGVAKGVSFSSIGRWNRQRKRLELMPEELLYLVERGSVQCWTNEDKSTGEGSVPMSVQWAWSEMIGTDRLSLERYQVYSYLKRLGYVVLRKEHVDSIWHTRIHQTDGVQLIPSPFLQRFFMPMYKTFASLVGWFAQPWRPASPATVKQNLRGLVLANRSLLPPARWFTYESIFRALRLISAGPGVPLPNAVCAAPALVANGGYEVFYYIYKPNSRFPKSKPPVPDFQVCVVDAEKMSIPNIFTTCNLLDTIKGTGAPRYPMITPESTKIRSPQTCYYQALLRPLFSLIRYLTFGALCREQRTKKPHRQNIFAKIKNGQRYVLLAVVDHGIISFFKFTETDFKASPLYIVCKTNLLVLYLRNSNFKCESS
ncbi:hypothetical protein O181_018072 [Austropuccinia psidii MF-1]|uniref:tRNA-splicing endonuclease subunit Sen54 N-terminal domain-containing protein n=1 Tax=Austropuccinia psidii MF-1 TaxID=1389203 RepID=A0A9Q3C745_9BASI|nr:hypothetical protein [Austropuccinia psidii MF-1]